MSAYFLATLNACLNFTAFCLLLCGFKAIRAHKQDTHRKFMTTALGCSVLFLSSYLTKYYLYGSKSYEGEGLLRAVYFFILATHVPLAMIIVPFILMAVYFAMKGKVDQHKRIVKWVYPSWIYVSVTGVLIYLLLYVVPSGT